MKEDIRKTTVEELAKQIEGLKEELALVIVNKTGNILDNTDIDRITGEIDRIMELIGYLSYY